MPKTPQPFGLRMPPEVKKWVADQAERNMRSQNAEVVLALKEKMERHQNEKSGTSA